MIKAFLGALLFTSSIYVGMTLKKSYKKTYSYYSEYLSFLDYAKERISFSRATTVEIKSGFVGAEIKDTLAHGEPPKYLGKEGECVKSFFQTFGKSDYQNTLRAIDDERTRIASLADKAKKQVEKKGVLAEKLCLLIGISLVIIVL